MKFAQLTEALSKLQQQNADTLVGLFKGGSLKDERKIHALAEFLVKNVKAYELRNLIANLQGKELSAEDIEFNFKLIHKALAAAPGVESIKRERPPLGHRLVVRFHHTVSRVTQYHTETVHTSMYFELRDSKWYVYVYNLKAFNDSTSKSFEIDEVDEALGYALKMANKVPKP